MDDVPFFPFSAFKETPALFPQLAAKQMLPQIGCMLVQSYETLVAAPARVTRAGSETAAGAARAPSAEEVKTTAKVKCMIIFTEVFKNGRIEEVSQKQVMKLCSWKC